MVRRISQEFPIYKPAFAETSPASTPAHHSPLQSGPIDCVDLSKDADDCATPPHLHRPHFGDRVSLNPQPLPPGERVSLNPQPLPPKGESVSLNPQPLPPKDPGGPVQRLGGVVGGPVQLGNAGIIWQR